MISYKPGQYMHIADCMSRNSLDDATIRRSDHTEPAGIWMEKNKKPVAWELECQEIVPQKLVGYEVGPRSMMIECTMTCAKDVQRGVTRESQSMGGEALRCEDFVMEKDADDDDVIDWSYDLWSANWAATEAAASVPPSEVAMAVGFKAPANDAPVAAVDEAIEIPDSLQIVLITFDELHKAQLDDARVQDVCSQLNAVGVKTKKASDLSKRFEVIDGVLHRKTVVGEFEGGAGISRIYVPGKLRTAVLRNAHNTVWGGHRNAVATFKEVVARYYWPAMDVECQRYVSSCELCQLAKGLKPSRQGFLSGWNHNKANQQICMDLIGPISAGQTGHTMHKEPTYIFVITDPFSHMLWLSCISGKCSQEVYDKFVENYLLEEGCCRVVLTDRGREFNNELLRGLMTLLRTKLKFTPAYHPRGNYTERVNRFIGESLRTMLNSPGAKKQDWHQYVKFVEFAYRRMHIPGTNISPYMLARGRQPLVPTDMALWEADEAGTAGLPMSEQVRELKKHMMLAEEQLLRARKVTLAKSREAFNENQVEEVFYPGEHVRYYNRLSARRHEKDEVGSKFKLRNVRYIIVKQLSPSRYLIKHSVTEIEKEAHVSQIARMRIDDARDVNLPIPATPSGEAWWKKVKAGTMVLFWLRGNEDCRLSMMEVTNTNMAEHDFTGWYYIHRAAARVYRFGRPQCEMK